MHGSHHVLMPSKPHSRHSRHTAAPTPHDPTIASPKGKGAASPGIPKRKLPHNIIYTPDAMIAALKRAKGMVTVAASLLGCDRQAIYNAMAKYPEIEAARFAERDGLLDVAELKLAEAVQRGNLPAILFYLRTQGKSRGYWEKQEAVKPGELSLEDAVLAAQKKRRTVVPVPGAHGA